MNVIFWLAWLATLILCSWKIVEAIRRPACMLQWPFLACVMWLYFYVYMAQQVITVFQSLVPDWALALGEMLPLFCLVAILYGWKLGVRAPVAKDSHLKTSSYPFVILWLAGATAMLIGAFGNYSVVNAISAAAETGDKLEYASSSAYWYLLFYVGYPGMAICLWAIYKMPKLSRKIFALIFMVLVVAFMAPNVINARRGPLFPTILILLLVPPLVKKITPRRIVFFGGLGIAAFVMLLFVQARDWIYHEGTWADALSSLTFEQVVVNRGKDVTDNEFLNNCHMIGALAQTHKYQYGTGHLELFVHWIPRALWPSKPDLGEGYYSSLELFDDVESVMHIRLLGGGAAAGGVADSFVQYGFLCPIMWFLLSFMGGRVYRKARKWDDPRWQLCYVGLMCSTHWLVAQGLAAALVPAMFFQAVPFVLFRFAPRITLRVPSRRVLRPVRGPIRVKDALASP